MYISVNFFINGSMLKIHFLIPLGLIMNTELALPLKCIYGLTFIRNIILVL